MVGRSGNAEKITSYILGKEKHFPTRHIHLSNATSGRGKNGVLLREDLDS